jgi:hypothetical protein
VTFNSSFQPSSQELDFITCYYTTLHANSHEVNFYDEKKHPDFQMLNFFSVLHFFLNSSVVSESL